MPKKHHDATKPLTICVFGTYDPEYTSNKLILKGLALNKVKLVEVNYPITVTRLDKKSEMTWQQIIKRITQKYGLIGETIKKWSAIKQSDIIYVGYPGHFDVLFAYIIGKLSGKKIAFNPLLIISIGFIEEQGILDRSSILAKAMKMVESWVYKACDLVFADTPFQSDILIKEFGMDPAKIRVLAIGADDDYYQFTPYSNTQQKIDVTYYGLYSPIHGVEYLIEAAHILKDDPDIHFTMVGNGNTFTANYQRAQELKLKNISFYHDVPLAKHPVIIKKADIFLGFLTNHPTVQRVIPNKVYQGLALNKVVLTADAPVIQTVFNHKKNIYAVKPENASALVDALVELKKDPLLRKRIAEGGNQLFKQEFSPRAVGKALKGFLEAVI